MIRLENEAGVSECSAYLAVEVPSETKAKRKVRFSSPKDSDVFIIPSNEGEIPRPPGQPQISEFTGTSLVLKWPASPSDINLYQEADRDVDSQSHVSYVIEYRSSKSHSWTVFASNIECLSTYVDNLFPGLIYSFRIRAENCNGISDCSPTVSTKNLSDELAKKQEPQVVPQADGKSRRNRGMGEKPSIVADGKDIRYYIEGQTAEISFLIFGFPQPNIKIVRNGKELESDEITFKMFWDRFGNFHFDIPNASEKDEGLYEIVASNEHGACSHEFYLQQADPPVFLEPFKDVTIENHQDVQLICKVDGIPYPEVKFYKDWHLLAESYRIRIKHIEPDTWVITINGAIVRDSGLYTCTAKNIAGGTLSSCNLTVADSLLNVPHPDLKTNLIMFKKKKFEEDYEIVEQVSQSPNSKVYRVIERRTAKEYLAKIAYKPEYTDWIKNEADCLNQVNVTFICINFILSYIYFS